MQQPEIDWSVPPDPHEIARLRELAKIPLAVFLETLEEMQILADHMEAQRKARVQRARGAKLLEDEPASQREPMNQTARAEES
jgi:hypothetical protein